MRGNGILPFNLTAVESGCAKKSQLDNRAAPIVRNAIFIGAEFIKGHLAANPTIKDGGCAVNKS
jgi:hypothetical protein